MSNFQQPGDFGLSDAVGRRLMTPGGAVAPGVAPELMPCLVLENDRMENLWLSGMASYGRGTSVAAGGAGTRSSAQLVALAQDTLVVVDRITGTAAGNVLVYIVRYGLGVIPFGTQSKGVPRDSRIGVGQRSNAVVVSDNTLAVAGTIALMFSNGTTLDFDSGIVLAPGDALYVCPSADNVTLSAVAFQWRERRLNQSERI